MPSVITKAQIQNLYAIASKTGVLESGNKDDNFHLLVHKLTGKNSVSKLNNIEFYKVKNSLMELQRDNQSSKSNNQATSKEIAADNAGKNISKKPKWYKKRPVEAITDAQIRKIWHLMYDLQNLSPSTATVGSRLKGIIKRQLKIDVDVKEPFVWLTSAHGYKLIEILKKYVQNKEDAI